MLQEATRVRGHTDTGSFLPESVQMELIELREQFKRGYFQIGDLAAFCIDTLANTKGAGSGVTNQEVFREIGKFCGKAARTVRYYYETAVFFPKEIRDRYDSLPFSHFVFARSYGEWERVLEYALEHTYASEEQLRFEFYGVSDILSADVCINPADDGGGYTEVQDLPTPNPKVLRRHDYLQTVSEMRNGVRVIRELMDNVMDEEERKSYGDLLYQLEPAIDYLVQVIEKMQRI